MWIAGRRRRQDVLILAMVMALAAVTSWWGARGARDDAPQSSPSAASTSPAADPSPFVLLEGERDPVGPCLAFSQDSRWVACAWRACCIYDVATGALRTRIPTPGGASAVAFSPDGKLVAVLEPRRLALWDAATGKLQARLEESPGANTYDVRLAWHPSGRVLAYSSGDKTGLYDEPTGRRLAELPGGSCVFSPGGTLATSDSDPSRLRTWCVSPGGSCVPQRAIPLESNDSRWVALPGESAPCTLFVRAGKLYVVPWTAGEVEKARGVDRNAWWVTEYRFGPDASFYLGSGDTPMHIVDSSTGLTRRVLKVGRAPVLSFDGHLVATAYSSERPERKKNRGDPEVLLWEVPRARLARVLGSTSEGVEQALEDIRSLPEGGIAEPESLGPFVLGATHHRDMRAVLSPGPRGKGACHWYDPASHTKLETDWTSIKDGDVWSFTLSRASAPSPGACPTSVALGSFATHRGIRLGDSEEKVRRLYGSSEPHAAYQGGDQALDYSDVAPGVPCEALLTFTIRHHRVEKIYLTLRSS